MELSDIVFPGKFHSSKIDRISQKSITIEEKILNLSIVPSTRATALYHMLEWSLSVSSESCTYEYNEGFIL